MMRCVCGIGELGRWPAEPGFVARLPETAALPEVACPVSPMPLPSCCCRPLAPLVAREATGTAAVPVGELPPSDTVAVGWYCAERDWWLPKPTTGSDWCRGPDCRVPLPPVAEPRRTPSPRTPVGSGRRGVPSCRAMLSSRPSPGPLNGEAFRGACCCAGCLNWRPDPEFVGPGGGLSDRETGAIFQAGAWPRLGALPEAPAAAGRLGAG
mmetsp:Transcript_26851/g.62619  ORF Transcript_26851/g.62619 Transcript_26851/m.62619 type:complete len:210 (+) Transcript_26851:681-1310(+)